MNTIRDKLWMWGHNGQGGKFMGRQTRMTQAEGAYYLGVPNVCMIWDLTLPVVPLEEQHQYAMAFKPFKNVVWSATGISDSPKADGDINNALSVAGKFSNIHGVVMDDFFGQKKPYTTEELAAVKQRLVVNGERLPLWSVYYSKELHMPVEKSLQQFDVVTFWTWSQEDLKDLERNFERMERLSPDNRKMLGCFMYDFSANKEMPISLMEKQCALGLQWLRQGRIDGMIFCLSWICDMGLEAVEWTREWIAKMGGD